MSAGRGEALSVARKLVRTLDSAPDPRQQAQAAVSALLRESVWAPAEEKELLDLAAWLAQRPAPIALKPRLRAVLHTLGA
jgi:hypothetical protein